EPLPDERERRPIARAGEDAWQLRGEFDVERNLLVGLHGLAERNTDHRPVVVGVVMGMNEFDLRGQVLSSCDRYLIDVTPTSFASLEPVAAQSPPRFLEERALLGFKRVEVEVELQLADSVRRFIEPVQSLTAFEMFWMLFVVEFELNVNLV